MTTYATDVYSGTVGGSQVDFGVTFPFIQRSHVKVFRIENSDGSRTELTVTTSAPTGDEYQWQSDVLIRVGTGPTENQKLSIERDTPEDQQLVQWADGSYIIAEDLNTSDKQWLYGLQELEDKFDLLTAEAIKYRGTIDLTVDAAPANPQNGDYFINSGSGTVVASWTGIAGDNVQGSEQVIYNSSLGEWQILETPASQKGVLEVTGTSPIQVDNTDAQRPVVSVDAATTTNPGVINEAASDNVTYGRENGAWVAVANTAVSANPPANPSNGDGWYDLNTGRLYLWINDGDSSQWAEANPGLAGGGASVEVDDTPPTNPSDGDLWWDSSDDSGRLYVYYEDGNTNQWVEASPPAAANPTVKVSDTAPANPEPGDLWWDSSETGGDNGGRLYFRYSDGDSVQWVQTSNVGGANGQIWGRTGTTISPATAGDDVDLGAGDLSAADGTFSGAVNVDDWLGGTTTFGARIGGLGHKFRADSATATVADFFGGPGNFSVIDQILRIKGTHLEIGGKDVGGGTIGWNAKFTRDGILRIGGTLTDATNTPNIELNPDGSAKFGPGSTAYYVTARPPSGNQAMWVGTTTDAAGIDCLSISGGTNGGNNVAAYINFKKPDQTIIGKVRQANSASVAYDTSSDYRLKENIEPIADAIDRLKLLKPCKFNWKQEPATHKTDGFIAHEAQAVVPDAVGGIKDEIDADGNPVYQGIDQSKLVPLLTAALQESITRIEALEARLATLEGN